MVRTVPGDRLSTMAACKMVSASSNFSKRSFLRVNISRSNVVEVRVYKAGIAMTGRGRTEAGTAGALAVAATARMAFFGCESQSASRATRLKAPVMSRDVHIFWAAL